MKQFTLLFSLVFVCLFGQSQDFFYKEFSVDDGLLSDDNYRSVQDKLGYIWICSSSGVVKYDGASSKKFTVKDGLPSNDIFNLHVDSKNRIWLYTFKKGLYFIYKDKIHKVKGSESYSNVFFTGEKNDTYYFAQYKPSSSIILSRFKMGNLSSFKIDTERIDGDKIVLADYGNIRFVQDVNKGIISYKSPKNTTRTWQLSEFYPVGGFINEFEEQLYTVPFVSDNYKELLVISNNSVRTLDCSSFFGGVVTEIAKIENAGYALIVDGQLRVYSKILSKKRDYSLEKKLTPFCENGKIEWYSLRDKENNIWLANKRGKIKFIPFYSGIYSVNSSSLKIKISHLHTHSNRFFVATSNELYEFNSSNNTFVSIQNFGEKSIRKIYSKGDKLYCLLRSQNKTSLFIYSTEKQSTTELDFPASVNTKLQKITSIHFLNDSTIIDLFGQLYTINGSAITRKKDSIKISGERVQNLCSYNNQLFWSNESGLFTQNIKTRQTKRITSDEISKVLVWNNQLIVGTRGSGVSIYSIDGQFCNRYLDMSNVQDIDFYKNRLFVATNSGVYLFKKRHKSLRQEMVLNKFNGLSSTDNSQVEVQNNFIYTLSVNGLDKIDFNDLSKTKYPLPTLLLNNITTQKGRKLVGKFVNWDENSLNFSFSGISYHSLNNIRYYYTLSSKNEVISNRSSSENKVDFDNLAPGRYNLTASCESVKGVRSKQLMIEFIVIPHVTQTTTFRILSVLFVLFVTILLIRLYYARRLKVAEIQRYSTFTRLQTLRSQLNPHFIFNAMNSIQYALVFKGQKEAITYMESFSSLIRSALNNSSQEYISLADELIFIENYLKLEDWRLSGEMKYKITMDGEINPSKVKLINMTLQPIIENSIIHGLLPKESDDKFLSIHFEKEDNYLTCTITDNGIGRAASEIFKQTKANGHKSLASSILKERMELVEKMREGNIQYETIDLKDETGKATGTTVILKIQIYDQD